MRTLPQYQNPMWSDRLDALKYAYNDISEAMIGYQSYQMMFGHKALKPCDNWLGLSQYNGSESIS